MTDNLFQLVSNPPKIKTEVESMEKREATCDFQVDDENGISKSSSKKEDRDIKNKDETVNVRVECENCDQDFCNKTTLKMHVRTVHLKEQRFICGECDYKTNNSDSLTKHQRSHTGEKPFACAECGKMWISTSKLKSHIRMVHLKEKRFSCEVCDYKTYQKNTMDVHEAAHLGGGKKPTECDKCWEVFDDKTQLSNHMVTAHNFKCCEICGKSFRRQLNLRRHKLKHTSEQQPNKCLKVFKQEPHKLYTPEFKIDAVKKVQEIGLMKASRLLNLSDTTLKKWRNIILRPLQCSLCGKEFSNHSDLKLHLQRHHPDAVETSENQKKQTKEHQCDKCSQLLMTNASLRRHMANCTGHNVQNKQTIKEKSTDPLKFICNTCGKTFKENRYLIEHTRCVHDKIKDNICEICSKYFARKKNLVYHIKTIHEKLETFGCTFCEKKFAMLSLKRRHERKHTGEKPYKCENCGESCSKYKAKQAEYQCTQCKVALVPVVLKQMKKVKPKDKDHEKVKKPRNKVKKQINSLKVSKSQLNFANLRELYRVKYTENGEDISRKGCKSVEIINAGELVNDEIEDQENGKLGVNEVLINTVQEYEREEMFDEITGNVDHKVQNEGETITKTHENNSEHDLQTANDEDIIIDELHFMKIIGGLNTEIVDSDSHMHRSVESSNTEMNENNHSPVEIGKTDSILNDSKVSLDEKSALSEQEIESKVVELNCCKIKDQLKSSFTIEETEEVVKSDNIDHHETNKMPDDYSIKMEIKLENNVEAKAEEILDECSSKELDLEQDLECEICQKIFLTPRNKREHMKWVHNEEKNLCCEFCSKMFAKQSRLADHVRCVHEKKKYPCEFCDKLFAQESMKRRHLKLHTGERPYLCQNCGHCFREKSDMTEHRSKHTKFQEFQCVECFKQFTSRDSLCNHVYKNHRVLPEFPCSICGKLFKQKDVLQRHEEFHLGIRDVDVENQDVFICTICEKAFKYQTNLTTHMKLHSEEKVPCFICGKQYTSARGLKEHVALKHERISKFKCQVCGKAFARAKQLEVHNSTHLKAVQCEICNQGYLSETSLMKHRIKEHSQYKIS